MIDDPSEVTLARDVTARHTRFWFGVARQIAVTTVIYALLVAILSISGWLSSTDDPQPGPTFPVTIDPGAGADLLAVLASIVIALNVLVWATRSAEISEALAHTRRRYLALCGSLTGALALLTGLASTFHDVPNRGVIDALILLGCAVFIAVLGNDTALLIGNDMPVQRQIPRIARNRRIRALERVAARWRCPRPDATSHLRARVTADLLSAAVVTALPLFACLAVLDSAGRSVDWWPTLIAVPGLGLFSVVLAAFTFVSTARSFVARRFDDAAASAIVGALTYVFIVLGVIAVSFQRGGVSMIAVALCVALVAPPVLIVAQLRADTPLRMPGWTIREVMYRSILRELFAAHAHQGGARARSARRRFARIRDWSDRVTGMAAEGRPAS
ncbi:hypothetical protein ACFWPA_13265 [Rhodococcus sp. NPDC058505]|uniref:hypothetical protein n=1 Tax=unclassified Rhodococcus (in: high G+C Gram-positive bacteria) TaxID=192944 RepID=UPI00366733C7